MASSWDQVEVDLASGVEVRETDGVLLEDVGLGHCDGIAVEVEVAEVG